MADLALYALTLQQAARGLASRQFSSVELTQAALARTKALNPRLNAFVTVMEEEALAAARRADRKRTGRPSLNGIPISVKDIIDTAGTRTTGGSRVFAERVPRRDALVVERLKGAGAVIFAKANLAEFAYGSIQSAYGVLRNPWDLERFSGGSSAGSGSAVATGMGFASIGSDTAGSIRMPASFCGVTGLKPTYGVVSREGVIPLAWSLDHVGPLARTVADAAIVFKAIAGNREETERSYTGRSSWTDYLPPTLNGVTIGIPKSHFYDEIEPEVAAHVAGAQRLFKRLGARIKAVDVPHAAYANAAAALIMSVEASRYHLKNVAERFEEFGEIFRGRLIQGLLAPAAVYVQAQQVRSLLIVEFQRAFEEVDLLLTPTNPITAHPLDESPRTSARVASVGRLTSPANLAGIPAMSLPCGFTKAGLPVGMQLMGRPYNERLLVRVGATYQRETDWHERRPPL